MRRPRRRSLLFLMQKTEEIIDGIKVLKAPCKVGEHITPSGKKLITTNIGWVAGFIYHDGMEWLFSNKDWASLNPFAKKSQQTKMLPSKEAAIAHAKKFQSTIDKYEVFVRPYQRERYL